MSQIEDYAWIMRKGKDPCRAKTGFGESSNIFILARFMGLISADSKNYFLTFFLLVAEVLP